MSTFPTVRLNSLGGASIKLSSFPPPGPPGVDGITMTSFSGTCGGVTNGSNTIFSIPSTPADQSLKIYRNGVKQLIADDYTIIGLLITFIYAPLSGDSVTYDYLS